MRRNRNNAISMELPVDIQPERGRIDILSEKYIHFSAVLQSVLDIVRWPIRFFTLSEEDQLKAGINMGGEKCDGEAGPTHSFLW